MERDVLRSFAQACGTDAEGGFYPLSANGTNEEVLRGERDYLPAGSRNMILPVDFSQISLEHEVAHDLFISGGITVGDRLDFIKNILASYRGSHDPQSPHLHKDQAFFARVAEDTKGRFDLSVLSTKYFGPSHWRERDFKVFAGECFAYACETVLHPERPMASLLPRQVFSTLRYLRIFQLERIRKFQQLTGMF
jgi:hypothetical protein